MFMRIFTYKLAQYLSTGDIASLQNVLFYGFCMVSRVCSGIPWSYRVAQVILYIIGLGFAFGCMLPVDIVIIIIIYLFKQINTSTWSFDV